MGGRKPQGRGRRFHRRLFKSQGNLLPRWRRALTRPGSVLRAGLRRVRSHASSLLLAATAAGTAFMLASLLVGEPNAVFAPVAAVVAIGLSAGQRVVRAVEISTGVVLGLLAADLLSQVLGVGPVQLAVAVLVAMTLAVAVRPSGLMANQAAVAAVVVMALAPHLDTGPWLRLADALIGGVVAVVLNALVSPDPYRAARSVTAQNLDIYAGVLRRLVRGICAGNVKEAEEALTDMEALDGARGEITEALDAARERVRLSRVVRKHPDTSIQAIEGVAGRLSILVATGRGLCRSGANLIRHDAARGAASESDAASPDANSATGGQNLSQGLAATLEEVIEAVYHLKAWAEGSQGPEPARETALRAATSAAGYATRTQASTMLVGQIRSACVDIVRITGFTHRDAVEQVERAASSVAPAAGNDDAS